MSSGRDGGAGVGEVGIIGGDDTTRSSRSPASISVADGVDAWDAALRGDALRELTIDVADGHQVDIRTGLNAGDVRRSRPGTGPDDASPISCRLICSTVN